MLTAPTFREPARRLDRPVHDGREEEHDEQESAERRSSLPPGPAIGGICEQAQEGDVGGEGDELACVPAILTDGADGQHREHEEDGE